MIEQSRNSSILYLVVPLSLPATTPSQNPKPFPSLRGLRKLFQFSPRQFAVRDDACEMIAHLADDVDGKKQLFASRHIVDGGGAPGRRVVLFERAKGFGQEFIVKQLLRANSPRRRLVQPAFVRHRIPPFCSSPAASSRPDVLQPSPCQARSRRHPSDAGPARAASSAPRSSS